MDLKTLAERTPRDRDRYLDFLRAACIALVVFGHWSTSVVTSRGGRLSGRSALDYEPGLWPLTWLVQVMPIFFFVGGYSNFTTLRRSSSGYLQRRMSRLLRPFAAFAGVWLVVTIVLHAAGVASPEHFLPTRLPFGPVWFLLVYVAVVALAPLMVWLHERARVRTLLGLATIVVAVDVLRFVAGLPVVGWLNMLAAWMIAHQLGFFLADGSLERWRPRRFVLVALGGSAAMAMLSAFAGYAPNMVGITGGRSNLSPPTTMLIPHTFWILGLVMAVRHPITRWLQRTRPWMAVIAANRIAMTVYLWHQTALTISAAMLVPLGLGGWGEHWGPSRAVWLPLAGLVLAGLVVVFLRFERMPRPAVGPVREPVGV